MDPATQIDHQFVVAAYIITWVLQFGFLVYVGLRWRAEKRNAEQRSRRAR